MIELGIALALVSRHARMIFPLLAAGMHVGILLLQDILFLDLILIQAVFYDWTRVGRALCGATGGASRPVVPAREDGLATGPLRRPLAITALVCFFSVVWVRRVEWYPFSSVGMFSNYDPGGVVVYHKVFATDERGRRFETDLRTMGRNIGRYRPILSNAFRNAAGRDRCLELLASCGAYHNAASPRQRVVKFEVERRAWNFAHDRDDPAFGRVIDHIELHTLDTPRVAAVR